MKSFEIAGVKIPSRYVLAPLAGYSDYAMRKLCYEKGARLLYTEMESCEALIYQSKATIKDIQDTKLDKENCKDGKLALQIFGGKEDSILKAIPLCEAIGNYDFLDFNCGCPVPKVIKQHAGSDWLNREDELLSLLEKMVHVSSKPVIIKIRIGFNQVMDVVSLCKRIEATGVKAIAIHGRTRSGFFSSPVNYQIIQDVKKNVSIPIIANGSIEENNFLDIFDQTSADALMIGQRAIGYPKVFEDMIRIEEGKERLETTLESQLQDLKEHLNLIFTIKDERSASSIMRSFSVNYLKGFNDCKKYRNLLVHCSSKKEYFDAINQIEKDNQIAQ